MKKLLSVFLLAVLPVSVVFAQAAITAEDQAVICKILREKTNLLNTNSEQEFVDEYLKQHPSLFCQPDESVIGEAFEKFEETKNEKATVQAVYERFCKKSADVTENHRSCI